MNLIARIILKDWYMENKTDWSFRKLYGFFRGIYCTDFCNHCPLNTIAKKEGALLYAKSPFNTFTFACDKVICEDLTKIWCDIVNNAVKTNTSFCASALKFKDAFVCKHNAERLTYANRVE